MMKKLFSGGGNDKSNWLGKVLHVGKHQCLIEEIIAEGGFALVFHVKSSLGQRYALKRVSVNELEGLEMCKQEIMILKKLSGHKNTILFVDSAVNVLSPGIYEVLILMEYCKAGHVIQLMNECLQTGFTEKMVMKIFCDVCEALALLHSHQPAIIHRDLKVENVLRKQSGDFVLCDYGSAYMGEMDPEVEGVQKVEEDIATCTTLPYRSPEMVDLYSGLKITTKSDIWALGCLLYKLCFFTTPFGESTLAIQNGQFSFPETSRFSDDLYLLIKMMLVVDQEKRPDIFHVANFAFRMTGKPCPVRNYKPKAQPAHAQLKPVETRGQNAGRMNRSASPLMPRAAQVSLDNADASDQKNNMAQQSREPVSTSLAPRQRPKGVNKFSSANDVATPTPFKNEQGDHHPQPGQRQLQQHVSQQQRVQVQQQAQYQQQQYQQKLLQQQQQQHQFQQLKQQQQQHFQQQQLKHQQQQLNQQQQQQRQQQQQQFQQQQQLQQQLYYQQMQDRQRMVQQRQTEQQQKLAFEQQQQQKLAFEQQQQQLALEQQRQYQQQLSAENVNSLPILNLGPTQIDGQPPVNPFEDNFAAGHSDDVFSNSQANNPFQTAQFSVTQAPSAENRAANYRSHFRSRSDTFSDLARRVNSSEDDTDSNVGFLKPVGDTNSPNKSVPDMRVVGNADPSSKTTPEVEFQNHSKTNDCATPIETEPVESLSRPDRLQLQQQQQKEQPPKQHVTQQPKQQPNLAIFNLPLLPLDQCQSRSQVKIHNGANSVDLRLSHSEPAFNTSSNRNIEAGKQTSEGVKEKMNIPTLAEADAFPLISPSSSVQERQYVYRRTSSCSSEELEKSLSESSEESSIEDEVDGDEDRVNYLKIISSSTSSLEEDADAMAPDHPRSKTEKHIENQASSSAAKDSNEEIHEDVFGSAPFCMNSLKISITKKPKKPSSTLRSDEKKSSGCLSEGRNKAFVDNRPSLNEKASGRQESHDVTKAKASEPITCGNPFSDSDPFTLHGERPSCSNGTRAKEHQKDNDSQDPFGSAPFVKVVRHKKPLSSEQLASQSHRHGRVQARRRMLPKAPIQE